MNIKYFPKEKSFKEKFKKGLVTIVGATCLGTGVISFIFGFEPQISYSSLNNNKSIPNFSLKEYIEESQRINGNNLVTNTLTYIAYPGAKLGRLAHNSTTDNQ